MSNESDTSYSNETISVIDDDEEFEEEEEVDIDDEVNDKEIDDNNKLKKSTTSSDVWDYVDKIERICPYCGKKFGKKTGTSFIWTHLGGHDVKFNKEQQTTLDSFVKKHFPKIQTEKTQAVI